MTNREQSFAFRTWVREPQQPYSILVFQTSMDKAVAPLQALFSKSTAIRPMSPAPER